MKNITDIMIYEDGSGGELSLKNDDLEVVYGLTNQVYLALFGGNIEQSTSRELDSLNPRKDYWGNNYIEEEFQFNSLFEKTIRTTILNTNGLKVLKAAAIKDLEYLQKYAEIIVEISIIKLNFVELKVKIKKPDNSVELKFIWDNAKNELIENITI